MAESDQNCSICIDTLRDPVIRSCGHVHCRECIHKWYSTEGMEVVKGTKGVEGVEGSCPDCRNGWVPRVDRSGGELSYFIGTLDPDVSAIMHRLLMVTLLLEQREEQVIVRPRRPSLAQRVRNGWRSLFRSR